LLIVLLLVASLAFVALSITEQTTLSSIRSLNERARSENLWRAFGAEMLAASALAAARQAQPEKMSLDDPWAVEPLVVPMDDGGARIFFADATACFNVNSLAQNAPTQQGAGAERIELVRLVRNLGLGDFEGERVADVIADWIDEDTSRLPQGAEDDHYAALPSPYRSGGQPIAAVTELRAMDGMSREIYGTLKPYLCAHNDGAPSPVNINMLQPHHAPLLAAMLGDNVTPGQAADLIAARPPGGYDAVADFLGADAASQLGVQTPDASRFQVVSKYIQARAEIVYDTSIFVMTSDFVLEDNGEVSVLRRRIGAEE
ncbi:MAG: type II secretion system minor pseudopilin GspK, partial [Hyphococcus sp.]